MFRSFRIGPCAPLVMLLFAATPAAASLFTGPVDFPVGANPTGLTAGDIDGDGDLDLVACHYSPGLVTLLLNDGTGAFTQAPGSPIRAVRFPISAGLGSFNGEVDGMTYLVVVGLYGFDTAAVSVFLGDGTGGFGLPSTFLVGAVGQIGRKVAVGDYDGDGRDDLAFADGDVRLGRGDGTFTSSALLPVSSMAFDVIARDFDGDGRPDLAFMSFLVENLLHVFLAGAGGVFYEAAGSPVSIPGEPETLAAGDFDGDADLDLAATDIFGQKVSVLVNDGGGGFAPAPFSPVGVRAGYPRGIAAADFDRDGRADLAVGSNNSPDLSILLADAEGGLTEIEGSPLRLTAGVPISIVAGDLDADDDVDLAAVDFQGGRIAVFLNVAQVVEVPIDIHPGSEQNVIQLESHGVLPVAILSTQEIDATTVDPMTVRLAGSPVRRTSSGKLLCQAEAVNDDFRVDLLCMVETDALQLSAGDTVATLEAVTFDGTRIQGQDEVRVLAPR